MPFASGLKTQGAQESERYRRQKGSHKRQLKHEWQLLALRPSPPLKKHPSRSAHHRVVHDSHAS